MNAVPRFVFPLRSRRLVRGWQAHINAGLGGAADYGAHYDSLFAPCSGRVEIYWGDQGGNWLRIVTDDGYKVEFAHLNAYRVQNGQRVTTGQEIAITGNTGEITDYPHLHVQIFGPDGKRIDPESIFTQTPMPSTLPIPNGQTMIVPEDHGRWYLIRDNQKCYIPDKETGWAFGLLPADARGATKEIADRYPNGPQLKYWEGHLFRLVEDIRDSEGS